ncbi:MAG: M50 family metallopeptidase [Candidatus Hermodarchaeota archaeon]
MLNIKIGKIYGIEIKLHISTLLIIGLVGFFAANFYVSLVPTVSLIDLLLIGIVNGLIILASILIHEMAHSIVAQRYGLKVKEIELYLFGGASKIEEEPKTPKSEIVISVVGPISSLVIGGILLLLLFTLPLSLPLGVLITLFYSGISNIGLGLFNLLPAFPVDGGRILRGILWAKRKNLVSATKTASRVGTFFAYGLIAYGFVQLLLYGLNGIWLIIIGSFLSNQTRQSYLQVLNEETLSHLNAKDMISLPAFEIPFDLTLSEAVSQFFMLYKKEYFPVIKNGLIIGIIYFDDIRKVPLEQRSELIVGYAMRKLNNFPSIYDDDSGKQVMKKFIQMETKPQLLIVKEHGDDFILGLIGKDDLVSSLRFCQLNPEKCK